LFARNLNWWWAFYRGLKYTLTCFSQRDFYVSGVY
jgi:hypothetical protein